MRPRPAFTSHELAVVFLARWQSTELASPFIRYMRRLDESILRDFLAPQVNSAGEKVRIRVPRFEWRDE
jgi:hypothetical protein